MKSRGDSLGTPAAATRTLQIRVGVLVSGLLLCSTAAVSWSVPAFQLEPLPQPFDGLSNTNSVLGDDQYPCMGVTGSMPEGPTLQPTGLVWNVADEDVLVLPSLDPNKPGASTTILAQITSQDVHVGGLVVNTADEVLPCLWSRVAPDPQFSMPLILPTLGGGIGAIRSGEMVGPDAMVLIGTSRTAGGYEKAAVWTGRVGTGFDVERLPHGGTDGTREGGANDLIIVGSPTGLAAGWSTDEAGIQVPTVWSSTDLGSSWSRTALPLLPDGVEGQAHAVSLGIDDRFLVLGAITTCEGNECIQRPALWESMDGTTWNVQDLGTLPGFLHSEALGILHDPLKIPWCYFIVGRSDSGEGTEVATLWLHDASGTTAHDLNDMVVEGGEALHLTEARDVGLLDGAVGICGIGEVPLAAGGTSDTRGLLLTDLSTSSSPQQDEVRNSLDLWPNPFSGDIRVSFSLTGDEQVRVSVHDASGRLLSELANRPWSAGSHSVHWDETDDRGGRLTPGVYFLSLQSDSGLQTRKVVLRR